jgi:MOSC domain-containing protein YiiM
MQKSLRLLTVCAGRGETLLAPAVSSESPRRIMSAIRKQAVSTMGQPTPFFCGALGLEGDEQVDLAVHGGRDKALYAYPSEHYAFWKTSLDAAEPFINRFDLAGAVGENLSTEGLTEQEVYLGDLWNIGEVTLQVTMPREPCFKFNAVTGDKQASKKMAETGYCGWYLAVITPGILKAGDTIEVVPGSRHQTIHQAFKQKLHKG